MNVTNNNYLRNILREKIPSKPKNMKFKDNPYKEFDYKKVLSFFNFTKLNSKKE